MSTTPEQDRASEPEFPNTIIPVFCTADIPTKIINDLLSLTLTHANREDFRLYILTSTSPSILHSITHASRAPFPAFASPFLGMTIPQVHDVFLQHIVPADDFTNELFIVLDQRTVEDEETCMLMASHGPLEEEEDEELQTLRCDFYVARQVAQYAELGVQGLLEGRERGQVVTIDEYRLD